MTKIDWKPIETATVKPFDDENWFKQDMFCLGATNQCFIGEMWYVYNSKGAGKWRTVEKVVYPTHWAEMPNLPE